MSVYRFNSCVVDPARRELTLSGQLVDVQPLIFDLLVYLLDHANHVVTKDDMLKSAWRSAVVSDSVVARAVMKLRRAIGDDASQAKTVLTVHRIGYRLVADVRREAAQVVLPHAVLPVLPQEISALPHSGLAITAFENLSNDHTLDALLPELGEVVRHLVGDQVPLAAVTATDALLAWQAASEQADRLAHACTQLRVTDLAVLSVVRSAGQYTVRLVRGASQDQATAYNFTGSDLLRLATRMAEALGGTAADDEQAPDSDPAFWQAQYTRSVRLHRSGRVEPALELLELCRSHLKATLPMRLMQGRLHLAVGEPDLARSEFELAGQQARADALPAMEFEVQMAQSELAIAEGRPDAGLQNCLQALTVLRAHPQLAGEAPQLIMRFANMMTADSRGAEAIQLADRAVATAQRLGLRSVELSCRLGLGRTLLRFRQLHRASDVLRRVVESAQPADDLLKLEGLLAMADVERCRHRPLESVEFARQARTLARRVNPARIAQAMALEFEGLLGAGQTDTVAQLLQRQWGFEDGLDPAAPPSVVLSQGVVLWRQGEAERAVQTLRALLETLPETTPAEQRTAVAAELCFMMAASGDALAREACSPHLGAADAWLLARLEAAQQLAAGNRDAARQRLQQAWFSDGSNPSDSLETGVDLAWMLLEDDDHDELERVIAQVLEVPSDSAAVQVLQTAYALSGLAGEQRDTPWRRSLAQYPGLLRRHAAVADGPRAARLNELFTRACC